MLQFTDLENIQPQERQVTSSHADRLPPTAKGRGKMSRRSSRQTLNFGERDYNRKLYWLMSLPSQLSLINKVVVCKVALIKHTWTIELWGSASRSDIVNIPRFRSFLYSLMLSGLFLTAGLQIPTIVERCFKLCAFQI